MLLKLHESMTNSIVLVNTDHIVYAETTSTGTSLHTSLQYGITSSGGSWKTIIVKETLDNILKEASK